VSFQPGAADDADHLDAVLTLRDGLPHPDLSIMLDEEGRDGITLEQRASERRLRIPGTVERERGAAIEEAIWEKMHFARHMRTERLGTFAVGTDDAHRSESLAITQVLILYHLVTAKAVVAVGGDDAAARTQSRGVPSAA
jgi:phosphoribulokinase